MTYIPTTKREDFDEAFYADRQQVFNYVLDRIHEQGCQNISGATGGCIYYQIDRDGKECRCAAGHILPKRIIEFLKSGTEKASAYNAVAFAQLTEYIQSDCVETTLPEDDAEFFYLVTDMQLAHDCIVDYANDEEFIYRFNIGMGNVATKHRLSHVAVDYWRSTLVITPTVE